MPGSRKRQSEVETYVTTQFLAFSCGARRCSPGSFAATVVFPVLLYAMQIIYRILKPDDTADDPDKKKKDHLRAFRSLPFVRIPLRFHYNMAPLHFADHLGKGSALL